jgi:hypothetical protein
MTLTTRIPSIRSIAAIALATLALILASSAARADIKRTGGEPWYQLVSPEAQQQVEVLFDGAVDKHQQLLRTDAMNLYEQALALWDNPDIRWNLAIALEELGRYLPAHQQLERAARWDAALGLERLTAVHERMHALETEHLARIEASSDEPGADVRLDGKPWFQGAARQSTLVLPGTHYVGATKSGYSPITLPVVVVVGQQVRVTLRMVVDHAIEMRRWAAWRPWTVVALGTVVTAVGAGLERQAFVHRDVAAKELAQLCNMSKCDPMNPRDNVRAATDHRWALGAFAAGGTAIAAGVVLVWLNRPRWLRPEVIPSAVELIPDVSPGEAGVSARLRF